MNYSFSQIAAVKKGLVISIEPSDSRQMSLSRDARSQDAKYLGRVRRGARRLRCAAQSEAFDSIERLVASGSFS